MEYALFVAAVPLSDECSLKDVANIDTSGLPPSSLYVLDSCRMDSLSDVSEVFKGAEYAMQRAMGYMKGMTPIEGAPPYEP